MPPANNAKNRTPEYLNPWTYEPLLYMNTWIHECTERTERAERLAQQSAQSVARGTSPAYIRTNKRGERLVYMSTHCTWIRQKNYHRIWNYNIITTLYKQLIGSADERRATRSAGPMGNSLSRRLTPRGSRRISQKQLIGRVTRASLTMSRHLRRAAFDNEDTLLGSALYYLVLLL